MLFPTYISQLRHAANSNMQTEVTGTHAFTEEDLAMILKSMNSLGRMCGVLECLRANW